MSPTPASAARFLEHLLLSSRPEAEFARPQAFSRRSCDSAGHPTQRNPCAQAPPPPPQLPRMTSLPTHRSTVGRGLLKLCVVSLRVLGCMTQFLFFCRLSSMLKLAAPIQISGAFGQSHEIVEVSRSLCRVSASEVAVAGCSSARFTSEGAGVVLQGQVTLLWALLNCEKH